MHPSITLKDFPSNVSLDLIHRIWLSTRKLKLPFATVRNNITPQVNSNVLFLAIQFELSEINSQNDIHFFSFYIQFIYLAVDIFYYFTY